MRLTLDTNVLIAAFISRGVCAELFEYCALNHTLVGSRFILEELRENLKKKFHYNSEEISSLVELLAKKWLLVEPRKLASQICRDTDDDRILGTVIAGHCECLITGDKDLLVLENYQGIDIIKPNQFWQYEKRLLP